MSFRSKLLLQRFSELARPVEDPAGRQKVDTSGPSQSKPVESSQWQVPLREILEQAEEDLQAELRKPTEDSSNSFEASTPPAKTLAEPPAESVEAPPASEIPSESHWIPGNGDAASADAILKGLRKIGSRGRQDRVETGRAASVAGPAPPSESGESASVGAVSRPGSGELPDEKITDYLKEFQRLKGRKEEVPVRDTPRSTAKPQDLFDEFFESDLKKTTEERFEDHRQKPDSAPKEVEEAAESSVESRDLEDAQTSVSQAFLDHMVAIPDQDVWGSESEAQETGVDEADLYLSAVAFVLRSIRRARDGILPDIEEAEGLIDQILAALETDSKLLLAATRREQEFAASSHSVNVTIISLRLAKLLGYSKGDLNRVGISAILHEIGVIRLPENLLHQPGKLTPEQIKTLRKRPLLTNQVFLQGDSKWSWLADTVAQIFEREDGSGFPLGLQGTDILERAKLIGIADLFDACIHKRPYRDALTGYQTLYELTTELANRFPERVVKALIKALSLYPYNEYVQLDTGEIARVMEINRDNLSRPLVEILYDKQGRAVDSPQQLELTDEPERYIARAIPVDTIADLSLR
ncbi:MAG: hypothetical protein JSU96_19730 [Acidobacteriota bacterium]|nr:MAG: hypothetical protein JSU96_19730 [Acidobacteriota bacterium]